MKSHRFPIVCTALLAGLLTVVLGPGAALAVTSEELAAEAEALQEQVNEAYATLEGYSEELELANTELYTIEEDLEDVQAQIEETEADIVEKEAELAEAQELLSAQLTSSYKQGGTSLLSLVVGASDFQDLFVRIFYANKVADYEAEVLEAVKTAKAELEAAQEELLAEEAAQEELLAAQEEKIAEIEEKVAAQQAYYEELGEDLQEKLAEEEAVKAAEEAAAAEAAAQAAAEAEAAAAAEAEAQAAAEAEAEAAAAAEEEDDEDDTASSSDSTSSSSSSSSSSSTSTSTSSSSNTDSGTSPSSVVEYALSKVGCSYSWGASGPNSFDCSGLTMWAYAQAGYSLPHNSQAQCNVVKNKGNFVTDASYLTAGDLVFFGSSSTSVTHVGIYIGDGQFVHASTYGVGVIVSSLSSRSNFVGGGSPV